MTTPTSAPAAVPMTPAPAFAVDLRRVALESRDVLRDVHTTIAAGRWTAVVGPNGAGKSTLLRALAGLVAVDGNLALDGRALAQWTARERARAVAWLGVEAEADAWRAFDVVMLGRLPHHGWIDATSDADVDAVRAAMQRTQCEALAERRMASLSAGERQRVRLARALAVDARTLLLDEPVTHLDPPHQADWLALVRALVQCEGRTVVSVLHDLNLALAADDVLVLDRGQLVAHGAPDADALRAAIVRVFEGRIQIARVGDAWRAWLTA